MISVKKKKPASAVSLEASFYPVFTGGVDLTANRIPSQHKYLPLILLKEKTYPLPVSYQAGYYILNLYTYSVNNYSLFGKYVFVPELCSNDKYGEKNEK